MLRETTKARGVAAASVIWLGLLCGCSSKQPAPLDPHDIGVVQEAVEGDILIIKTDAGPLVALRLAQIDAPELDQAFGVKAKLFLDAYVRGRRVVIKPRGVRGDLLEAQVLREDQDLSQYMVEHGFAWVRPEVEDEELLRLQNVARRWRVNLWMQANVRPPWEFRGARATEHTIREVSRTEQIFSQAGISQASDQLPECRGANLKVAQAREAFSACLRMERGNRDCSAEQGRYWALERQYRLCFEP